MTIIDVDVSDAVEPMVMEPNEEYKIRIVDVRVDVDKNGHDYFMPRFEVVDQPTAKEFSRFYGLPHADMDPKQLNNCKFALKTFFEAFGIDPANGVDPEAMKGLEAWAILGVKEDAEYGAQNIVKKFVAGN